MTVCYHKGLKKVRLQWRFPSLMCRWRGSLYKLCYKELICFLVLYGILSAVYRLALKKDQQELFESVVRYVDRYLNLIPLSFILGFYVTIIAARWWQQFIALPWPDRLILAVAMYVPGTDPESKLLRQTLCRQCNLIAVLLLRSLSDSVRKRLQSLQDIVDAGFMTKAEMECYQSVKTEVNLFWLPGLWFAKNLSRAQRDGLVTDQQGIKLIMEQLLEFRSKCAILWNYGWVNIPLVYTQVVTLSTYSFFTACIVGRQYIEDPKNHHADVYFPLWTVLQFLFYMGLLKVAEQMINPYGDDDEDFELNFLLNRHATVINLTTGVLSDQCPPLIQDDVVEEVVSDPSPSPMKEKVKRKISRTILTGFRFSGHKKESCIKLPNEVDLLTTPKNVEKPKPNFALQKF